MMFTLRKRRARCLREIRIATIDKTLSKIKEWNRLEAVQGGLETIITPEILQYESCPGLLQHFVTANQANET